ncbi:MAG TPA: CASC3 protein CASC3 [Candidatus Aphodovivens excrementavium]|nr:CASC3 protein CASC3 [Candidatus Aphodovivens excrementavium]
MSSKSGTKKQKQTAKQKEARIQAAIEREERAKAKKAQSERLKKVFTVVVCIILVLALFIPTMAIAVLGGN